MKERTLAETKNAISKRALVLWAQKINQLLFFYPKIAWGRESRYDLLMEEILKNLYWIEELLPRGVESARRHSGVAYYLEGKLIMILVDNPASTYEHKGISYPFQIWNGCILPVEFKKQSAFFLKFLFLENHPANKDWLYIPADSENFEDEVKQFVREITKGNPLLGTTLKSSGLGKEKKAAEKKPALKKKKKVSKADKKKENSFLLNVLGKK